MKRTLYLAALAIAAGVAYAAGWRDRAAWETAGAEIDARLRSVTEPALDMAAICDELNRDDWRGDE